MPMQQLHSMTQDRSSELDLDIKLGEGSFGQVFRARHKATGAIVAVKVVPNEADEEADKIMGEIDILSKCNSPFIVGYFECFVCPPKKKMEGGEMWIVMEFCDGGSVSDLIEAAGGRGSFAMPEEAIAREFTDYLTIFRVCYPTSFSTCPLRPWLPFPV